METALQGEVLTLVRLRCHLRRLQQQGQLDHADFSQLDSELDRLSLELAGPLEPETLPELVRHIHQNNPRIQLSPLQFLFQRQRAESLLALRALALGQGLAEMDVSSVIEGLNTVPLERFSWQTKTHQYRQLLEDLRCETRSDEQIHQQMRQFFETDAGIRQLIGLPPLRANIVRHLYVAKQVTAAQALVYQRDEEKIRAAWQDAQAALRQAFHQGDLLPPEALRGEAELYRLLQEEALAPRPEPAPVELIVQWQGPDVYTLLNTWLKHGAQHQRWEEMALARTGFHPREQPLAWQRWLENGKLAEQAEHRQLQALIDTERLIYDIAAIVSQSHWCDEDLQLPTRWLPLARALARQSRQVQIEFTNGEPDRAEQDEVDDSLEVDEIDSLVAPEPALRREDALIQRHSNWNRYVRPFLSENWLGLIGIGFIMAAWPILSMMVWEKGEYYRLAAGAVPLLFVTLGSAWITRFFSRLSTSAAGNTAPGNHKPVQLFACLTTWTLPFNILMSVSLFDAGAVPTGTILLLIYSGAILLMAPWLEQAYGYSPKIYLLASHGVLLLPAAAKLIPPYSPEPGLAAMTYLAFFCFAATLFFTRQILTVQGTGENQAPEDDAHGQPFQILLLGVHGALALAATHIFYQTLPQIGTLAVLVVLAALGLFFLKLFSASASQAVVAGAMTVLGNLLALAQPGYLLVTLSLSALFWAGLHRAGTAKWPAEVFAVHCIALAAAIQHLWALPISGLLGLAAIAAAGVGLIESRFARHELKLFSWGIPVALLAAAHALPASGLLDRLSLAALLLASLYNYHRCGQRYQVGLWFVAVAVVIALPLAYNAAALASYPLGMALYMPVAAAGWALLSPRLKDIPAQMHGTTVLWATMAAAAAVLVWAAMELHFAWRGLWFTGLVFTILAALLAARRAQSILPVYIAGALLSIAGFWIKHRFGLHSRSGLGSAVWALALVLLAPLLQASAFFRPRGEPDRFFSRPFFLYSKQYLRLPLEHFAWVLVAASVIKTLLMFAPSIDNIKVSLANVAQIGVLLLLSRRYQLGWIAGLALVPTLMLIAALTLSLDATYQPLLLMSLSIAFAWGTERSERLTGAWAIVRGPLRQFQQTLSLISIPAALVAYGFLYYWGAAPWQFLLFGLLCLFYIQRIFVSENTPGFSHLNLIHIGILWSLFYLLNLTSAREPSTVFYEMQSIPLVGAWYLLGGFALLFAPAYAMEWIDSPLCRIYHRAIQPWLAAIGGLLMVALLAMGLLDTQPLHHRLSLLVLSMLAFQCGNRAYHARVLLLCKWLTASMIIYALIPNLLYSLLGGCFLFLGWELTWRLITRAPYFSLLRLQGTGERAGTPTEKIAQVGLIAGLAVIAAHSLDALVDFNSALLDEQPLWLFTLVPLSVYLYKTLHWQPLSYAAALVFTYTNIFVALQWQAQVQPLGLTSIHLLCGALVASLLSLAAVIRLMPPPLYSEEPVYSEERERGEPAR